MLQLPTADGHLILTVVHTIVLVNEDQLILLLQELALVLLVICAVEFLVQIHLNILDNVVDVLQYLSLVIQTASCQASLIDDMLRICVRSSLAKLVDVLSNSFTEFQDLHQLVFVHTFVMQKGHQDSSSKTSK